MGFAFMLQLFTLPTPHILQTTGRLINTASCPDAQTTLPMSELIDVYLTYSKSPPGLEICYCHQGL